MFALNVILQRAGTINGGHPAMLASGQDWAKHVDQIARLAGALVAHGLTRGDRFAILARNSETHAALLHAGYWSGLVPVPLNWRLSAIEIADQIADCAPKLVFADDDLTGLLAHAEAPRVIPTDSTADDFARSANLFPPADLTADDPALLLYTGGTTGRAKGVMLSNGNILANAFQVMGEMGFDADSRYLHVAPMFHSADLLATAVTMLGGAHAFMAKFTPAGFIETVARHGVTHTMLAPTMIKLLIDGDGAKAPTTLRTIIYGSSAMDQKAIIRACAYFGSASLMQGYGLTEASPLLTILGDAEHRRIATGEAHLSMLAGLPLPGVELKIDRGEVMARGPNVVGAYYRRPEDSAAVFEKGWFRTGDIGTIDADGYLQLLDRAKDMIVTGGENVYSAEVEQALLKHAAVADVAVIGLPDPTWGESVIAVVVARDPRPTDDELADFLRARLGGYKIPKRFVFRSELPRSALGKVLKHELRTQLGDTS